MATGVAGGTEEVWNAKELARRCGVCLGEAHPNPRTLAHVLNRVGVIAAPIAARVGELDKWLLQFHGQYFSRSVDGTSGEVVLSLTADGAEKFAPAYLAATSEAAATVAKASALATELRTTVFDELRAEAERKRAAGELYKGVWGGESNDGR